EAAFREIGCTEFLAHHGFYGISPQGGQLSGCLLRGIHRTLSIVSMRRIGRWHVKVSGRNRGSARSKIEYHAARHSFDEASVDELLPDPVRLTRSPNPRSSTRRLPFRRPAARQHSPMTCRKEAEVPGPAWRPPTRPPRPWHSPCPASHPRSRRPPRPPREKGERSSKSTRRFHPRPPRRPVQYRRRLSEAGASTEIRPRVPAPSPS